MRRNVEKFTFSYKSFMRKVGLELDLTISRFFFRRSLCVPGVSNRNTCPVVKPYE